VLFLGPLAGTYAESDAEMELTGDSAADNFGVSVGFVGAQDGTPGVDDILVGATGDNSIFSFVGAVYVFSAGR
jgi:hypothetical protein